MAIQPLANPNVVAHWPTDSFKDRLIAPEILNQALEGTPKHTNADGSELEARTPLAVFTRGRAIAEISKPKGEPKRQSAESRTNLLV